MKERRNQNYRSVISIKRCQGRKKNLSHFDYQIEFEDENYARCGIIECHKNVIGDRLLIEMRCCKCNNILV